LAATIAGREILPTENQQAFNALHAELLAEWEPRGALQEATLANITALIWRRQNLYIFHTAAAAREKYFPILNSRTLLDASTAYFKVQSEYMTELLDAKIQEVSKGALSVEKLMAQEESQKSPSEGAAAAQLVGIDRDMIAKIIESLRSNKSNVLRNKHISESKDFLTSENAVEALRKEVSDAIGPNAMCEIFEKVGDGRDFDLAALGDAVTVEVYGVELKLARRIDKEIDRNIRRLVQLKKWENERNVKPRSKLLPPYK
jgi:hypothetical protein